MIARREQPVRLVLSHDLGNRIAEIAHVAGRGWTAVYAQARPARLAHLARDASRFPGVEVEPIGCQPGAQSVVDVERKRHQRSTRTAPDDVGTGPATKGEVERAEQHRLPRAGLTRKDRRAVGKFDFGTFDQAVTLDLQVPQHYAFFAGETLTTRVLDGNAPEHLCLEPLQKMQRLHPRKVDAFGVTANRHARARRNLTEHVAIAFEVCLRALRI